MILAQSLAEARAQRTQRVLPDGRAIWVSRVFPTSGATPEMPMASLVEQLAHTVIPTHFHAVNQFQVLVEGQGTLGKRAVHPWTVHYTNGFTGYGPLCAAATGMAFFTLRNRWDAGGARYFPAGQSFMQPAPKRHHLVGPLALSSAAALHRRQHAKRRARIEVQHRRADEPPPVGQTGPAEARSERPRADRTRFRTGHGQHGATAGTDRSALERSTSGDCVHRSLLRKGTPAIDI